VAYDDENPDEMLVETIITYDKDNRMVHRYTNTTEPLMQSHDQYYLDESGRLFYVLTELAGNTLYINRVYYDGARLDVAQKSIDGKTELELVYDFTQQTPQSFEDMRVVDDLDLYLTYDGQTCTVEGFND
jgi:hypothetical protein